MVQQQPPGQTASTLGREGRITAVSMLKYFYDEEIFARLVKDIYDADPAVSEAAIRASASLGNEVAVTHLNKIIERGRPAQRLAAVQALAAIRAPSSAGMLLKYFNHFPEEDVRTEILRAINLIAPTSPQVQQLAQAVVLDTRQGEEARRIAIEALVDGEKLELVRDLLPKIPPAVQEAAFAKMLQAGGQEVPDFTEARLAGRPLGAYLCLCAVKARTVQQNWILETLQRGQQPTIRSFLTGLTAFQGRLRFPTRVFRLLLVLPYLDAETEGLLGDFLRRIVTEVRSASPHLVSEFSVIASAHLDNVFAKVRKNTVSLAGITRKEELLAAVLARLLERWANPQLLLEMQTFFREEASSRTPPLEKLRGQMAGAPKEELNRLEACLPLFALDERKERLAVAAAMGRVDLTRPLNLRRLNRLIRVAGSLEIKTASKRIQEILEYARAERVDFLEETSIVTLCQLLTRSIIEQSREYFREPGRNIRSLMGYVRGARWMPPRIMIGPLVHLVLHPSAGEAARRLAVESMEAMDLSEVARSLQPLLKALDQEALPAALRLRIADLLGRYGDATHTHIALDLTGSPSAVTRQAATRVLRGLGSRGAGVSLDVLTHRLYLLLDDPEREVRLEALTVLLALNDDYAAQYVADQAAAGDVALVADLLRGLPRTLSRETFGLLRPLLGLEDSGVQEALRALGPELSKGAFAEETKQLLKEALGSAVAAPAVPRAATQKAAAAAPVAGPSAVTGTLGQAKDEFRFKHENTQVLTVFFSDIAGYTEKSTLIGMKALQELIQAFEDNVGTAIDANQGHIVKKMGDGILATFLNPVNAVIAAMTVQQKIAQYNSQRVEQDKFLVRIGLHTGKVIRRDNDIFGEVVNVASRMQSKATPGDILLTEATFTEVKDFVRCTKLGSIEAKGIKEAITAYSPGEVIVDLATRRGAAAGGQGPGDSGNLERLRESMFVPDFRLPPDKAGRPSATRTQEVFGKISQAVEDIAPDYHQAYDFKRWLQKLWDELAQQL